MPEPIDLIEQFKGIKESLSIAQKENFSICFPTKRTQPRYCAVFTKQNVGWHVEVSYFIGADWVAEDHYLHVQPKVNSGNYQVNYLQMLMEALKHPEVLKYTNDLYQIKMDRPMIPLQQSRDMLTPLLVVHFISLLRHIVRKGLKKSYYKVEKNLISRIKGKVMVAKTIKQNLIKNKVLHTYCSYEEFGINSFENRLLKKALVFVQKYLPSIPNLQAQQFLASFADVMAEFALVEEDVNIHQVKHTKQNVA